MTAFDATVTTTGRHQVDSTDDGTLGSAPIPSGGWLRRNWTWMLLLVAVAVWTAGLRDVAPEQMNGFGLIGQLSVLTLLGYPLAIAAAVGELARPHRRGWVLGLSTATLTLLVLGLQPAVESAARLPVAWLHAGFAETIATTGSTLTAYDARFSWPGFFAAVAFIAKASGLSNPAPMLTWAPLVLGGMAVLAIRALAHAVFGNRRVAWLATWIFLLANWTEQEYFSPQGTAMVLFIASLAVAVRYLVSPGLMTSTGLRPSASTVTPRDRIWAQLIVIGLVTAIAPTHQLTPYVLVGMLFVLLVCRRLTTQWLPFLAGVPVVAWFIVGARGYWSSHLSTITGAIGRVDSSVSQGIGQRFAGDTGHQLMVTARVSMTLLIGLLAVIGLVMLRRRGIRNLALPALTAFSFGLAVLQSYGGEVFVRCYLYALPWLAIAAAVPLGKVLRGRSEQSYGLPRRRATAIAPFGRITATVAALALVGLTTVALRGGNDAYVSITADDTEAMDYVYAHAVPGDSVIALLWYAPLRMSRVADVVQAGGDYYSKTQTGCDTAAGVAGCVSAGGADYIVVNPQQESAGEILDGFPAGWLTASVAELQQAHGYRVVFEQGGVQVLASAKVAG